MSRQRKSDKYRKIEGRGMGRNENYKPWQKVHEVPSDGLCTRLLGWKVNRIYQFLSNQERDYFLNTQWEDSVIDIREQYPLLPLNETILIAEEMGIKHPSVNYLSKPEIVMTTDFIVTIKTNNGIKDIARTIKSTKNINYRVVEKFKIEELYWKKREIDWGVVTEENINKVKARNIRFIYDYYFWNRHMNFKGEELRSVISEFCKLFEANEHDVYKTTSEFDRLSYWQEGKSLSLFKYLIANKIIKTDMNKDFTEITGEEIKWSIALR